LNLQGRLFVGVLTLCVVVLTLFVGCRKSGTTPSPPVSTNVIKVTSAGVVPRNIVVPRGSQVTFVNEDTLRHDMQSDPHPEHDACPELRQVGLLLSGETRVSGNLNNAMTCGFHDNENEGIPSLRGTIVVQ
jgi:hypothetical protein